MELVCSLLFANLRLDQDQQRIVFEMEIEILLPILQF